MKEIDYNKIHKEIDYIFEKGVNKKLVFDLIVKNIAIENNVEIKPKGDCKKKYPFSSMNVGDSFTHNEYSRINMTLLSNAGRSWAKYKNNGFKFSVRKENNTIRIFRIK